MRTEKEHEEIRCEEDALFGLATQLSNGRCDSDLKRKAMEWANRLQSRVGLQLTVFESMFEGKEAYQALGAQIIEIWYEAKGERIAPLNGRIYSGYCDKCFNRRKLGSRCLKCPDGKI